MNPLAYVPGGASDGAGRFYGLAGAALPSRKPAASAPPLLSLPEITLQVRRHLRPGELTRQRERVGA